jgi:hypothetical protein
VGKLRKNLQLHKELNPLGSIKGINRRKEELQRRRDSHARDSWYFLTTGKSRGVPPYGQDWNRDYNPRPYPEAVPDPYMYSGTGIGFLYGYPDTEQFAWEMAGWNVVRTNAEVRSRRKW